MGKDGLRATPFSFDVSVKKTEMVNAEGDNVPAQKVLYLTPMDISLEFGVPIFLIYAPNNNIQSDPATVIKKALARVLDYFYPLSGRIRKSPAGDEENIQEIFYNRQGVPFAAAQADCTLESIGYLFQVPVSWPSSIFTLLSLDCSLYPAHTFPVTVQVTKFKCGGYILGMVQSHMLMDGVGSSNFIKAFADMALCVLNHQNHPPSPLPAWDRHFLAPRTSLNVQLVADEWFPFHSMENLSSVSMTRKAFHFTAESVRILKESQHDVCTSFEALTAFISTCYAKAADLNAMTFCFTADAREAFAPPIPQAYCGNCFLMVPVTVQDIRDAGMIEDVSTLNVSRVVKAIKSAKAKHLCDEYMRSYMDLLKHHGNNALATRALYHRPMIFADYRMFHLGTNFGWGSPVDIVFPEDEQHFPHTYYYPSLTSSEGITKVGTVIPEHCAHRFESEMIKLKGVSVARVHVAR